jgi:hypothetical protein
VLLPPSSKSPLIADRAQYIRSCLDRIQAADSTECSGSV